ncbi:MAG: alpha/beta fold hydrolase [Caulobacter sp.]|nr:alpha/beta fold hydrolase [Caulobacter sp.]
MTTKRRGRARRRALQLGLALAGFLSLALATTAQAAAPPRSTCAPALLPLDGNKIWARKARHGATTVVFEAGFGNDSGVWAAIEPRIRAAGAQTLVYDRAGMGQSVIDTRQPYSLDNDVHVLRTVLSRCGVAGPIVFVGHSYGGAIGLVLAAQDPDIRGMVLLDAVVPGVWTPAEVDKNLKAMRPQYDEIRQKAPGLAKVAIPWAEALSRTAREVNELAVSEKLPIIDIVAENGQNDPDSARVWRGAHVTFTEHHPERTFLLAEGSSHKVMVDKPDLVVSSILAMLQRVAPSAGPGR